MACARSLSIDIDPVAIDNARENAELNHVSRALRFSLVPIASLRRHFDLITANILSSTLIEMAPPLLRRVAPGGRLILAGILAAEAPTTRHRRLLDRNCAASIGAPTAGWTALVLAR